MAGTELTFLFRRRTGGRAGEPVWGAVHEVRETERSITTVPHVRTSGPEVTRTRGRALRREGQECGDPLGTGEMAYGRCGRHLDRHRHVGTVSTS